MKNQTPEVIQIERINWKEFRVCCQGVWVTIKKGDVGFGELNHYFPVFKSCHGIACGHSKPKQSSL